MNYSYYKIFGCNKLSEADFIEYQTEIWWEEYGFYDYAYGGIIPSYKNEDAYHPLLLGHYEYITSDELNLDEISY